MNFNDNDDENSLRKKAVLLANLAKLNDKFKLDEPALDEPPLGMQPPMPPEVNPAQAASASSFDVRANRVISPEENGEYYQGANSPYKETNQASPVDESQIFSSLSKLKSDQNQEMSPLPPAEELGEYARAKLYKNEPTIGTEKKFTPAQIDFYNQLPEELKAKTLSQETRDAVQQANSSTMNQGIQNAGGLKEPIAKIMQDPMANTQFKQYTGVDLTPEIAKQLEDYDALMKDPMKQFTDSMGEIDTQMDAARARIAARNPNDKDKYLVGLTLLVPILAGLFAGAGAQGFLGAFGGALTGFGKGWSDRHKLQIEDEDKLTEMAKDKANLANKLTEINLQRAKLGPEILKNMPKNEKLDSWKGSEIISYVNPENGEERIGAEVAPGLYYDWRLAQNRSKEKIDEVAKEIIDEKTYVDEFNRLSNDVIEVASQMKDTSMLEKIMNNYILGKKPDVSPLLGQMVTINGRKVNSSVILDSFLTRMTDIYNKTAGFPRLTERVQEHVKQLFSNPIGSFSKPEYLIDQVNILQDELNRYFTIDAENHGFLGEPLKLSYINSKNKESVRDTKDKALNDSKQILKNNQDKKAALRSGQTLPMGGK